MQTIAILISDISRSAGTERAVVNLCNCLVERTDNHVYIISVYSKSDNQLFYKIDDRVKVIHLGYSYFEGRFKRCMDYFELRNQIKGIIKENNIQVILGTIHAYNILLSTLKGIKRIGCEHLNYFSCPTLVRPLRRLAYRKLDFVVLLTQQDASHYGFLNPEKICVIPNISSFESVEEAQLSAHKIIMVGRFAVQKGYDILIDIISKIKHRMQDWTIDIYGQGQERALIEKRIKEDDLQKIIKIHSPVSNIRDKMLDSSIYLMTSRNEGLPMVLIEAQSCGLPIVAFDCPEGPREIVTDNVNGFLVENFDSDLLGDRIIELIENSDKRKEFGLGAINSAKRFTPDAVIARWTELFIKTRDMNNV